MSLAPTELKYAASHEWLRLEADGSITVGITDHAQEALGDLVFVELPAVDAHFEAGQSLAIVESVKAAADVYAPISGTIIETNAVAVDAPEQVNSDPYATWLFRLRPDRPAGLAGLLDAAAYLASVDTQ